MPWQVRQIGKIGKFLSSIARVQRKTGSEIAAYCLMANHVHLLMYDENGAYGKINDDKCLEYDSTSSYTDSEAVEILLALIGNQNPQCLQSYEREPRDEVIQELKRRGLTVRQISRLTGINRNIVQRARVK